jgi:epsin
MVAVYFRDHMYIIKTLREFQYTDEDGKDQGANVRHKAKDITNLLMNESSQLNKGRKDRGKSRDRSKQRGEEFGALNSSGSTRGRGRGQDDEDDELKRAIEESKRSAALNSTEDRDLQQAIRRSEEEENKRMKAVEDANAASLFDDDKQL